MGSAPDTREPGGRRWLRFALPAGRKELRRSFPVRLAFWGFLLVPASAVVGAAAGNATGVFAAFPFIVGAVVAALVLRISGRGLLPSLVVALLLLLGTIDLGLLHLSHPQSFSDFVPTLLRLCGFALAVAGTTAALRGRRSGIRRTATRAERRALIAGGIVVVAVAVVSGILTAAEETTVVAANGAVIVTLKGDEFIPKTIRIRPGEQTRVLVRNRDSYAHTFTIDAVNVDQYIGPHSERLVTFTVPAAASKPLKLYCAVTGHGTMTGEIVPKA